LFEPVGKVFEPGAKAVRPEANKLFKNKTVFHPPHSGLRLTGNQGKVYNPAEVQYGFKLTEFFLKN